MDMPAIIRAWDEGGDWEAVYLDGKLWHQGHSIDWRDLITYLGIDLTEIEVPSSIGEGMGYYPHDLADLHTALSENRR